MPKNTIREKWRKESACYDIASSVRPLIEEFFMAEFDSLLAEKIQQVNEIEEWEETYCKEDEHLFKVIKKQVAQILKK